MQKTFNKKKIFFLQINYYMTFHAKKIQMKINIFIIIIILKKILFF